MSKVYDCIVLGCGAIGSAALYYAARKGWRVLGLEQFRPGHDRGSSHGQTRIIRQAYFEHPDYVPLALESYRRFAEIEQASNESLFFETGLLQVGHPDGLVIQGVQRAAKQHSLDITELSNADLAAKYPQFQCRASDVGLFEKVAGFLRVEKCVETFARLATESGAELICGTRVQSWQDSQVGFTVTTDSDSFHTRRLIVTAGAWTSTFLPAEWSRLRIVAKHQHWFDVQDDRLNLDANCPVFFFETDAGYFYGFPKIDERGCKLAEHSGGQGVETADALNRDLDMVDLQRVQDFMHSTLNCPRGIHKSHSTCMYTMSPDEHFIVDAHPELLNLAFACGLSGHGFKFSPTLGQALVDMVDGERRPDMDFLSCRRFATST